MTKKLRLEDVRECFLSSGEGFIKEPYAPTFQRFIRGVQRDDWAIMGIQPAVIGQQFGFGGKDIEAILVVPRFMGVDLRQAVDWPIYVHVAVQRVIDAPLPENFLESDINPIWWGELCLTREEAQAFCLQ